MLVLGRTVMQKVVISVPASDTPQQIVVSVGRIISDTEVRLGFEAEASIRIARAELRDRPQIEIGNTPIIRPEHLADIASVLDEDAEPSPRYMTPMMKLDWATRKPRNHDYED